MFVVLAGVPGTLAVAGSSAANPEDDDEIGRGICLVRVPIPLRPAVCGVGWDGENAWVAVAFGGDPYTEGRYVVEAGYYRNDPHDNPPHAAVCVYQPGGLGSCVMVPLKPDDSENVE